MSIISLAKDQALKEVGVADTGTNRSESPLTKYIPTEAVTIYVAALASLPFFKTLEIPITNIHIYGACVVLTILMFVTTYFEAAQPKTVGPRLIWGVIASVVAFLVWGLSIPGNPFLDVPAPDQPDPSQTQAAAAAVAGVLAIVISGLLTWVEKLLTALGVLK